MVQALDEICWNCATLTMRFQHQGQKVTLQGEKPCAEVHELIGKLKLVQGNYVLFALHGSVLLSVTNTGEQEALIVEQQHELTTILQQFQ